MVSKMICEQLGHNPMSRASDADSITWYNTERPFKVWFPEQNQPAAEFHGV